MISRGMSNTSVQKGGVGRTVPVFWTPAKSDVMKRLEVDSDSDGLRSPARVYPVFKRAMDIVFALAFLVVLSPCILITASFMVTTRRGRIILRTPKVGRNCTMFIEYTFAINSRILSKLPVLINILKGELSFIGPRAVGPDESFVEQCHDALERTRYSVRPGLVCDWWIRRYVSMDYIDELVLDAEYVRSLSLRRDASVLFRAVPGLITWLLFGNEPAEYPPTVSILGIRVDNLPMQAAIDRIAQMLASSQASHVCFINPHNINQTFVVPEYKQALERADLILADGFGTKLAGKILHRPLRQNLCGTDLFPRLCKQLADTEKSMYLLGALPGGAERTADWVREHYPNVVVRGCHHGYFSPEEEPNVVRDIAQSGADILVISMGVPTQELWADKHLKDLNVKVAMGFGGLFDYFSGRIPRAPRWVREIGMEWVYRLIQEPRRMWRRYLIGNFVFLARVLRERICGTGETSSNATTG